MRGILYSQLHVDAPQLPASGVAPVFDFPVKQVEDALSVLLSLKEPEDKLREQFVAW